MEEQIGFHQMHRSIELGFSHVLCVFTVRGNEIRLTPSMDIEYTVSEDEDNYIEYEYDENLIINTLHKAMQDYKIKLYLQDDVLPCLENFRQGINKSITLSNYLIEIKVGESLFEETTEVTAKKQLIGMA